MYIGIARVYPSSYAKRAQCKIAGTSMLITRTQYIHLPLPIMCWAPLEYTRTVAIYRHVTGGVKSCASKAD